MNSKKGVIHIVLTNMYYPFYFLYHRKKTEARPMVFFHKCFTRYDIIFLHFFLQHERNEWFQRPIDSHFGY